MKGQRPKRMNEWKFSLWNEEKLNGFISRGEQPAPTNHQWNQFTFRKVDWLNWLDLFGERAAQQSTFFISSTIIQLNQKSLIDWLICWNEIEELLNCFALRGCSLFHKIKSTHFIQQTHQQTKLFWFSWVELVDEGWLINERRESSPSIPPSNKIEILFVLRNGLASQRQLNQQQIQLNSWINLISFVFWFHCSTFIIYFHSSALRETKKIKV